MAALSLDLMDITRDCVSSLCDALPGLYCRLQFLSSASEMHAEIRRLTWPLQNISLFYLQKLLGCFCCMFCVMVHLYYEALPNQLSCIWLNLGREYIPVRVRIHPAASVLCHIITKHQWPSAAGSHAAHAIIHCSTMFHRWRFFGSWVVPSLLHTISFPSFWYRMMLIS